MRRGRAEVDLATDDGRIPLEVALPGAITEDDRPMLALHSLDRREALTHERPDTQRSEEVGRDESAGGIDAFAGDRERGGCVPEGSDLLERPGLFLPVLEVGGSHERT